MKDYQGILFFGQSVEIGGRGISGARLRTAAKRAGYDVLIIDFAAELNSEQILAMSSTNR